MEVEEGGQAPHRTFCKGEAGEGRLQDGTGRGWCFLRRSVLCFLSFCPIVFLLCPASDLGKGIEAPRLDGRTPHFGAGKCCLGRGLEESLKAENPNSCHSPFGWMQLVNIFDFTHTPRRVNIAQIKSI